MEDICYKYIFKSYPKICEEPGWNYKKKFETDSENGKTS